MFSVHDWRGSSADVVGAALQAEADRWRSDFAWDVSDAWQSIEPARRAGTLPGFIAVDSSGRVVGWTCFLVLQRALQVAVLTAHSAEVTEALIDAIMASPDAARADLHAVCVRDAAPALRIALAGRGFETVTYRYLTVRPRAAQGSGLKAQDAARSSEHRAPSTDPLVRPFKSANLHPLIRLCRRAYGNGRELRAFAPFGTDDEWHDYVNGLIAGPGCGRLLPAASLVIDGDAPGMLHGALIATDLGHGTAHIAQVAVDPDAQGRGVGTTLVEHAMRIVGAGRFQRVTLLVSSANQRAARLYSRLGFRNRASFVVAVNRQPRRLSSVALATGGVSTRR